MKRARLFALMATFALAACGESTGLVGDLTEQEAEELAAVVFTTAFTSAAQAPDGPAPAGGPQQAPYAFTREVDYAIECALDGAVGVSAFLDVEGDTESDEGRIEYELTLEHDGCTAASPNQVVFTVDGAPNMTVHLVAENDGQGNIVILGSLDGRVEWSAEGRDGGVCEMDLDLAAAISQSEETMEFHVSGVICRFSIEASASIG